LRRGRDKTIYSRSASGPSATMAMRSPSICERCPVGARDRAEPWTASWEGRGCITRMSRRSCQAR